MKNEIVGRVREKRTLEKLRRSKDPELLALYGRRRVGKTFLIRKYFGEEETYFELTAEQETHFRRLVSNEDFREVQEMEVMWADRMRTKWEKEGWKKGWKKGA